MEFVEMRRFLPAALGGGGHDPEAAAPSSPTADRDRDHTVSLMATGATQAPSAWERSLSAVFGFGQGCCINIYLSAAGYYGEVFQNERFFVWMCACIYLPPLLVFPAASRWNHYFDTRFGARRVFAVRLAVSLVVAAALVACLSLVRGDAALEFYAVLALGTGVGLTTGSLANSSSQFFGALAPELTSWFYLGQTASGAYVNVTAKSLGFAPGCSQATLELYYVGGVSIALLPSIFYGWSERAGVLESAYARHGQLIEEQRASFRREMSPSSPTNPPPWADCSKADSRFAMTTRACQLLAVAQNMSLTPLANRLSHGNYHLGQEIVLTKLLADFLGRSIFYVIPVPRRLTLHLSLNVIMQLCRLPVWFVLVLEILRHEPGLSEPVLLLMWIPFVAAGALGGSWSTVVALEAVPAGEKTHTAGAMTLSVYLGFLSGLIFAVIVSYLG